MCMARKHANIARDRHNRQNKKLILITTSCSVRVLPPQIDSNDCDDQKAYNYDAIVIATETAAATVSVDATATKSQ